MLHQLKRVSLGQQLITAHRHQLKPMMNPKRGGSLVMMRFHEQPVRRESEDLEAAFDGFKDESFAGFPDVPLVPEPNNTSKKSNRIIRSPILTRSCTRSRQRETLGECSKDL
ncbi:uncharacterized protein LOC129729460 [Wyeomyia smithii]|uniref:uncharacterized protein LOC129729460 n=1 Tax=Wyeomyia smithii TaxID=174621 RepID=UPI002467B39F|nr:uncharacterized protein LOC129729460 [Wyeomyia smithii]